MDAHGRTFAANISTVDIDIVDVLRIPTFILFLRCYDGITLSNHFIALLWRVGGGSSD